MKVTTTTCTPAQASKPPKEKKPKKEKKVQKRAFDVFAESLSAQKREELADFFTRVEQHNLPSGHDKKLLREDFERAVLHYAQTGVDFARSLALLAPEKLGGFYARPPILWFPLDDAAKIYPFSLKHGRMPMFRLSFYLKEDIVPCLLQMALHFTVKRFPAFATTLKKGFFWHYLDTAKRRFCAEPEADIPCRPLKVSVSGSQSFRVLYHRNRISVEFFHVLTDGVGGIAFLKVLAGEYLRLRGVEFVPDESIWDVDALPSAQEAENTFARIPHSPAASGFTDKPAVQYSGKLANVTPCRVIHFRMSAAALKEAAKRANATVTVFLLSLLFVAGKAATDELTGEASIQVPVNMRKYHPTRTVRNFSLYCGIRLPLERITDPRSITGEITTQLQEKGSMENMGQMLTSADRIVNMTRFVPLLLKQPIASAAYGFLSDKLFSNTLSNLGIVKLPATLAEHVDHMDAVLGPTITNRAACGMITFGDSAVLTVTKMTADPTLEEWLYRLLCAEGLEVTVEGSCLYEN